MIYGKGMKRGSEDIQLVILLIKNCVDHQNFTMFLQPPIDLREMSCDWYRSIYYFNKNKKPQNNSLKSSIHEIK